MYLSTLVTDYINKCKHTASNLRKLLCGSVTVNLHGLRNSLEIHRREVSHVTLPEPIHEKQHLSHNSKGRVNLFKGIRSAMAKEISQWFVFIQDRAELQS